MASTRRVTVTLPARDFTFDESVEILRGVLGKGGHMTCFSGLEISFTNEVGVTVTEDGKVTGAGERPE